jgi:NADPH:quinone reductase-like Zn-dependent oxidoreductase
MVGLRLEMDPKSRRGDKKGDDHDLIFDTVGVTTFAGCKDVLGARGTYLPLDCGPREMVQALLTLRSTGKTVKYAVSQNTREGLEFLTNLIESGVLKPVIDHEYPLEQIAEAHRHVEGRHKSGSVIVTMGTQAA